MARSVMFLATSVLAAVGAHWVYGLDNAALTLLTGLAVLLPAAGIAWQLTSRRQPTKRQLAGLAIAAPFPYTPIVWLYGTRTAWLPESLQEYVNNPTAYLLIVTGLLAVSMAWTSAVLLRVLPPHTSSPGAFRALALTMFVLMGAAASLGDPVWTTDLFRYVLEPLGTVMFGTVFGWQLGQNAASPRRGSLGLS